MVKIVLHGSRKPVLQVEALAIFATLCKYIRSWKLSGFLERKMRRLIMLAGQLITTMEAEPIGILGDGVLTQLIGLLICTIVR